MIRANRIEEDLIVRFIDAAQKILPDVRVRSVEKFEYDDSSYLRVSLDLDREIDIESEDAEAIQKIASALPVHPRYNISMTFTDTVSEDNEIWLSFLQDKYKSSKVEQKRESFLRQLWYRTFGRVYVRRGSMLLLNSLVVGLTLFGCLVLTCFFILYFTRWAAPDFYYAGAANSLKMHLENPFDYYILSSTLERSPALERASRAARDLESALSDFDTELKSSKDLSEENSERRRRQLFALYEILRFDPFVGREKRGKKVE